MTYDLLDIEQEEKIIEGDILTYETQICLEIKLMECTNQRVELFIVKTVNNSLIISGQSLNNYGSITSIDR